MAKYIFSQGTVRVEKGVYKPSNDKPREFGVLIVIDPKSQAVTITEEARDKKDSSDDSAH